MAAREIPEPYRLADQAIQGLNRRTLKKTESLKHRLIRLKFDEVEVMNGLRTFYEELDADFKKTARQLYRDRYLELFDWLGKPEPKRDVIDELVDMWFTGFFEEPNVQTHYIWDAEVLRKRDRAVEAIWIAPTKMQKQLEIDKAVRIWTQMSGWYMDFASQDAEQKAYKDAKVQKVRWMVYGDDRVCQDCEGLNGTVWDIDRVPDRPHINCRCWLKPIEN